MGAALWSWIGWRISPHWPLRKPFRGRPSSQYYPAASAAVRCSSAGWYAFVPASCPPHDPDPGRRTIRNYAGAITRISCSPACRAGRGGAVSKALTLQHSRVVLHLLPALGTDGAGCRKSGALSLLSDNMMAWRDMMVRGQAQFLLCHRHPSDPGLSGRQFRSSRRAESPRPLRGPGCLWPPALVARRKRRDQICRFGTPQSGPGRILAADWKARISTRRLSVMAARLARPCDLRRGWPWHRLAAHSLGCR